MENNPILLAHEFCGMNEHQLRGDKRCGCFYCLAIFSPDEITDWIPEKRAIEPDGRDMDDPRTARCPHCGIDSVIGESSGYPVTKEFLKEMRDYWFRGIEKFTDKDDDHKKE